MKKVPTSKVADAKAMWHAGTLSEAFVRSSLTIEDAEELFEYTRQAREEGHANNIAAIEEDLLTVKAVFQAANHQNAYYHYLKAKGRCTAYVYFFHNKTDGLTKIGFTEAAPRTRLAQVRSALEFTGAPCELVLGLAYNTTSHLARAFERRLHELYAEFRQHGEWFALSGLLPEIEWMQDIEATLLATQNILPSFARPIAATIGLPSARVQPMYEAMHRDLLNESIDFVQWSNG